MDNDLSLKAVLCSLIAITVMVLGLAWAIQGSQFFLYRYFAPKEEAVRRQVFEESKAYNEGMAQELRRMQMEYIKATPTQKPALASIILHQYAGYDTNKLPPDLQQFLNELKHSQGVQ